MSSAKYCWLFVFLLCIADESRCQLFEENYSSLEDYRSLGISTAVQDFGPAGGNTLSDSAKIHIHTPMWLAEYRQMGVRIAFGYSSYKFNNDSRSEISLAAESITDISFTAASERNNFFLPVIFSTNFVRGQRCI